MAKLRMDVGVYVGKLLAEEDTDVLREGIRVLAQVLMDAEVSSQIGAELYERTDARVAHRNGYRTRTWDTLVGTIELQVPKIAPGSYFPSLLEPPPAGGEGPGRGDPGGLREGDLHPEGRRPGPGPGDGGNLQ
jgi:Transposase, Mutator family